MEEKIEIFEIPTPNDVFGEIGESIVDSLKNSLNQNEIIGILSVEETPVNSDMIQVDNDYTSDYSSLFEAVKMGSLNEAKGMLITNKDGVSIFLTGKDILKTQKLYEMNGRALKRYYDNSYIASSIQPYVTCNKIENQSVKNILDHMNIVMSKLTRKGSSRLITDVKSFLYDIFLNPTKKNSLKYYHDNDVVITHDYRKYLSDVIVKTVNNPSNLSFFIEENINIETTNL